MKIVKLEGRTAIEFVQTEQELVWELTIGALKHLLESNDDSVSILKLVAENATEIVVYRENIAETYTKALEYMEKTEQYNMCSKLIDFLKKYEDKYGKIL